MQYVSNTFVLLPVSTQKLSKTSLFLTKKSQNLKNRREIWKIDEKSGDRSTSKRSISSNNGRNVKNRVLLESSGVTNLWWFLQSSNCFNMLYLLISYWVLSSVTKTNQISRTTASIMKVLSQHSKYHDEWHLIMSSRIRSSLAREDAFRRSK